MIKGIKDDLKTYFIADQKYENSNMLLPLIHRPLKVLNPLK